MGTCSLREHRAQKAPLKGAFDPGPLKTPRHSLTPIPSPEPILPSWAWPLVQSPVDQSVSRLWVTRSHFAVAFRLGPVVFPNDRRQAQKNSARPPLIEFRRPPGSYASAAGRDLSVSTPPLGFRPRLARSTGEVRFTRALPARQLPSSGFGYPLDGFLPRQPSRVCFDPAVPRGPAPSKHFLAGGCPTLLPDSARLPLSADLASTNQGFTEAGTCGPGFRVLPQASPEPLESGRGPIHRPVAPMGFRSLPRDSGDRLDRPSSRSPLTRLVVATVAR